MAGERPGHGPLHLSDSVRLKCRQSEERKSWSRSLSSSSLVAPGKAVRFLDRAERRRSSQRPSTPTEKAAMAKSNCGFPQKDRVNLGKNTAPPKERGPAPHLKPCRPSRRGWGSPGFREESCRGSTPSPGNCAENSSKCLRGRGSSLLIRGDTGAEGGSPMLRRGKDRARGNSSSVEGLVKGRGSADSPSVTHG